MKQRTASVLNQGPPAADLDGLLQLSGITVPSDGVAGYATGCIFQHTDGTTETSLYVNEGSDTSAAFKALAAASTTEISDLSDVGTTVYTAGMLLVASGTAFAEVAVSSHATLAANGALTLATVSKVIAQPLSSLHPGGSALSTVAVMSATPGGDGAELGLAVTAGAPIVGTSTNNTDATEHLVFDFPVPEDYVVGEDLIVRISFLMTAAANATSDLDVVAKIVKAGALDSTDICATAAKDMKDVVAAADQDFTITGDSTGDELAPGSIIHFAVSAQRDDQAGSTAGTVQINKVDVIVPCYR